MTENTRTTRRFQYHVEDLDCCDCLHYSKQKKKKGGTGCGLGICRFEDIREDAIANGRIKRERGYFRCRG